MRFYRSLDLKVLSLGTLLATNLMPWMFAPNSVFSPMRQSTTHPAQAVAPRELVRKPASEVPRGMGICHSFTPDGRCVSLLKILLTNHCIFDCQFCVNRITSDTPRARFTVEEVVRLTIDFYRRNYIEGLFLSSGIIQNSDYTMQQLIEVAKRLRQVELFGGYNSSEDDPRGHARVNRRSGLYADRLSVNVELPTEVDLKRLAPDKNHSQITAAMDGIRDKLTENQVEREKGFSIPSFSPAGQSTQMIVGATDSSDQAILQTASRLYSKQRLRRVYYSAYSPIPHADAMLPVRVRRSFGNTDCIKLIGS